MAYIDINFAGKRRKVWVVSEDCKNRRCFHPHNCPIKGAKGVRHSEPRWMCLTNFLHGCPEREVGEVKPKSWTTAKRRRFVPAEVEEKPKYRWEKEIEHDG